MAATLKRPAAASSGGNESKKRPSAAVEPVSWREWDDDKSCMSEQQSVDGEPCSDNEDGSGEDEVASAEDNRETRVRNMVAQPGIGIDGEKLPSDDASGYNPKQRHSV